MGSIGSNKLFERLGKNQPMEIKNKKPFFLIIVLGLVAVGFFYFKTSGNSFKVIEGEEEHTLKPELNSTQDLLPKSKIASKTPEESLSFYGSALKNLILGDVELSKLLSELEAMGLNPSRVEDKNDYTGNMTIIRTNENLPGTRYFHGQFFSNENGGHDLQHLSFDFEGGISDMSQIGNVLSQSMGISSTPEVSRDGYRKFRVNESYILWAKLLTKDDYNDMKSDPYKAYSQSDIGKVIRVAIEQEIH